MILLSEFLADVAPYVWPKGERAIVCPAKDHAGKLVDACFKPTQRPMGMVWDLYGIAFDRHEFIDGLYYRTKLSALTSDKHPVIATPGLYGDSAQPWKPYQRYIVWSDARKAQRAEYVRKHKMGVYLALHFRNGSDWVSACEHAVSGRSKDYMASSQCVLPEGYVTKPVCLPSLDDALPQLIQTLRSLSFDSIYIGTDDKSLVTSLKKALKQHNRFVHHH